MLISDVSVTWCSDFKVAEFLWRHCFSVFSFSWDAVVFFFSFTLISTYVYSYAFIITFSIV